MELWAQGMYSDLSHSGTMQLNAQAIGEVRMLEWIINIEGTELSDES